MKIKLLICTGLMLNDHSNPYIESTTVLSDNERMRGSWQVATGTYGYERYTVVLCVRCANGHANGRTQRARRVSPSLQWSHHGRTHLLRPFVTRNSVFNPLLRVYVYRYSCMRYPRACGKFPVLCIQVFFIGSSEYSCLIHFPRHVKYLHNTYTDYLIMTILIASNLYDQTNN